MVQSLCDCLTLLYGKLNDGTCHDRDSLDAMFKLDERLREAIIKPICHSLKHTAYTRLGDEIETLKDELRQTKDRLDTSNLALERLSHTTQGSTTSGKATATENVTLNERLNKELALAND